MWLLPAWKCIYLVQKNQELNVLTVSARPQTQEVAKLLLQNRGCPGTVQKGFGAQTLN